jgi:hypothetical protein
MSDNEFKFAKLTFDNYHDWATYFKAFCVIKECKSALTDEKVDPAKDELALAYMLLYTTAPLHVHIAEAKTAKAAWDKLASVHNGALTAKKLELSQKLQAIRKELNESYAAYMARVERLHHDYTAAGGKMEESEAVLRALTNLPTSVKSAFSSVLLDNDTKSLTFAAITPQLLALDTFIAPQKPVSTALFAGSGSRRRNNKQCDYCGHKGHSVDECRRKQRDLRNNIVRDRVPDSERTVNKQMQQGSNTVTAATATTSFPEYAPPSTVVSLAL